MEALDLQSIRLDGGTQSRAALCDETIEEYAEHVDELPWSDVFYDGNDYWLADGFHRWHAHHRAGRQTMRCHVRQGTRRDAILFSVSANDTHGLRRTNADKRRAVETLLNDPEWSGWSDRVIAEHVGVSNPFVSGIRNQLLTVNTWGQPPPKRARRGRDGKSYSNTTSKPNSSTGGSVTDPPADAIRNDLALVIRQRLSDPDFASWRNVTRSPGHTRAERMAECILDGGDLALLRLGLDWSVTAEQLKAAHRSASKRSHPDCGGSQQDFIEVQEAHRLIQAFLEERES